MNTLKNNHDTNCFSLEMLTATPVVAKKKKKGSSGITQRSIKAHNKAKIAERNKNAAKLAIHNSAPRPNVIKHVLDDTLIQALEGKYKTKFATWEQELFDPFDRNFDGHTNEYSMLWDSSQTEKLWRGVLDRTFEILSDCSDYKGEFFNDEITWIASKQFELVTKSFNLDPYILREGVYQYLKEHFYDLSTTNKKLIIAFHNAYKLFTGNNIQLTTVERSYLTK
jgi:hypothetical protein